MTAACARPLPASQHWPRGAELVLVGVVVQHLRERGIGSFPEMRCAGAMDLDVVVKHRDGVAAVAVVVDGVIADGPAPAPAPVEAGKAHVVRLAE